MKVQSINLEPNRIMRLFSILTVATITGLIIVPLVVVHAGAIATGAGAVVAIAMASLSLT